MEDDRAKQEEIVFSTEKNKKADCQMWLDGIVANTYCGYGSSYDGAQLVMAICDNCIESRLESGHIAYIGHSFIPEFNVSIEHRRNWRRINNLDELI